LLFLQEAHPTSALHEGIEKNLIFLLLARSWSQVYNHRNAKRKPAPMKVRDKNELKAELQGIQSALDELEVKYQQGLLDIGRYLQLKADFEARKAKLQELASLSRAHPPAEHAQSGAVKESLQRAALTLDWRWVATAGAALVAIVFLLSQLGGNDKEPVAQTPGIDSAVTREADGMVMLYVPGGTFLMGSEDGAGNELPVHSITLDSYWIDRTEVSVAQYALCVESGKCSASSYTEDKAFKGDEHPIVDVTWQEAADYCAWAGARLPTEAEWEYAARGPEGNIYPWGDEFDCSRGNFYGECDEYDNASSPVDSFESGASWCGALNMAGNVWEWVDDWYAGYPDTSYQSDAFGTQYKVLRGGSWTSNQVDVRSGHRDNLTPNNQDVNVGFRCVSESGE
jgi:formylglycine-generating enzyme required for sulfatase activity